MFGDSEDEEEECSSVRLQVGVSGCGWVESVSVSVGSDLIIQEHSILGLTSGVPYIRGLVALECKCKHFLGPPIPRAI